MAKKRIDDGTIEFIKYHDAPTAIVISPTDIEIVKSFDRKWNITSHLIGNIEKLAQSRYEVERLTDIKLDEWKYKADPTNDPDKDKLRYKTLEYYIEPIATSVYASAEIEGESISISDMEIAIIGEPGKNDYEHQAEYELRVQGVRSIYDAYLFALSRETPLEGGFIVKTDFIKELHKRMFEFTKPDIAGKFKETKNQIVRDNKAVVTALDPEFTEPYMDAICKRISDKFAQADHYGAYSKLIAIAEFLLDFLAIHPFPDGNGRMARLLSTYLLEKAKFYFARFYSLDSIILEKRKSYYDSLYRSQMNWGTRDEDLTAWIQFYIEAVYAQYSGAKLNLLNENRKRK
jgi:Fic family protein